ncbi:MAG: hypothetical protein HQM14_17855 [SAR324 cluster bacterium]|nr:hypothetical protein [SAR324 cluster bacterium]
MHDALRTTSPSSFSQDAGLQLDVDQDFRLEAKEVLARLGTITKEVEHDRSFLPIVQMVQAQVIDQAYNQQSIDVDVQSLLNLKGPNDTELNFEVFRSAVSQQCTPEVFESRTRLKIHRTLLNLRELRKAFGGYQLQDLEEQLNNFLEWDKSLKLLKHKLVTVTRSNNFTTYLEFKQNYLDQWKESKETVEGKQDSAPLAETDLSSTMKALLQQKSMISDKPQVLRYTDYQFFRRFNATPHQQIQSNGLDFWKTEENRDCFHQLVTAIRNKFQVDAPFHVFRFENSFTYLLCGFSDEHVVQAITRDQNTAPVYAKIVMRQSNKVYRELQSVDTGNRTLYFNCLKEAMLPFVEQLNQRLQIDLPTSFIDFFRV